MSIKFPNCFQASLRAASVSQLKNWMRFSPLPSSPEIKLRCQKGKCFKFTFPPLCYRCPERWRWAFLSLSKPRSEKFHVYTGPLSKCDWIGPSWPERATIKPAGCCVVVVCCDDDGFTRVEKQIKRESERERGWAFRGVVVRDAMSTDFIHF